MARHAVAGCMGFVDTTTGVRAIGYLERDPLPAGPIALVTHSGSVFSALLRTHRALGFSVAVSSGQELVTTTADHLGLCAVAAVDAGGRAGAGDACATRPGCGAGPGRGGRARHPGVRADGRAPRPAGSRWSTPTRARSPGRTRAGRRCSRRTACIAAATWPTSPTASSCSRSDGGRSPSSGARARDGRTTRGPSGCWSPTSPSGSASRSPRSRLRPSRGCPRCSTPASSRPTRSTSGAAAPTPSRCSATAWPRWPTTRASGAVALAVDLVEEYDGDETLPAGAGGAAGTHRQAGRRAGQPRLGRRPGRRGPPPGRRGPGARGHGARACGRSDTCWRHRPRRGRRCVVDSARQARRLAGLRRLAGATCSRPTASGRHLAAW